uniref:Receptor-like kinase n=1 Tax=Nitella axillaris TaxID=3151 RepID=A7VM68_9VIRI|nr:receptor-like kinase [Nitella axillaris]
MSTSPASSAPLRALDTNEFTSGSVSGDQGDRQTKFMMVLAIGVPLTAIATIAFVLILLLIRRQKKKLQVAKREEQARKLHKTPLPAFGTFRLKALRDATCDFTTVIGKGGFGTVYKAYLTDGTIAAIKRMDKGRKEGDEEFRKEVLMPGRLHHRHLVNLIGFCAEKGERMLVLEYMANGSLKEHLHDKRGPPLDWQKRMRIAVGVAAGLEYLHSWSDPPVIHRDVKSSNVLLSENFTAKVSDFGLCKVAPAGSDVITSMTTDVMGTPGYMDPEYVNKHVLTEKSDVFSYGVVLLELITGRHAVQEWRSLVDWAQIFFLDKEKVPGMVDPALGDNYDLQELYVVVEVAQSCTLEEGSKRPTMKQVLKTLTERLGPNTTTHSESQPMHRKVLSVGTSGTVTVSSLSGASTQEPVKASAVAAPAPAASPVRPQELSPTPEKLTSR